MIGCSLADTNIHMLLVQLRAGTTGLWIAVIAHTLIGILLTLMTNAYERTVCSWAMALTPKNGTLSHVTTQHLGMILRTIGTQFSAFVSGQDRLQRPIMSMRLLCTPMEAMLHALVRST